MHNTEFYDRYSEFRVGNNFIPVPSIEIPKLETDETEIYDSNNRLDKISNKYYLSPLFGWLIKLANPDLPSMEFDYPNNTILRIPFPLKSGIERYIEGVKEHKRLNG